MLRPTTLPWRRPRHETLLLALVAVAALTPVYVGNAQDNSHFCLSRALAAGHLTIGGCANGSKDVASDHGRIYSNKAPGTPLLAVPAVEAVRLPPAAQWNYARDARLWVARVLTSGLAFVICAFLVGRVAEGLAGGAGGFVLVSFALGTFAAPFAATGFDHVPTAAFSFAAFVLAWGRRPLAAGLCAGCAYCCEYEAAAIVVLVAVYVALAGGRALGRYAVGLAPGVVVSSGYSWLAFGAPWRIPQHYDRYRFPGVRSGGLLGVHAPTLRSIRLVFVGDRGLLVATPLVVAAAAGLWLLWHGGRRAESLLCALVTLAFVAGECGYGDPYGGTSAGLRYMIPAFPFLVLAAAFARYRRTTVVLAALSLVAIAALTATWARSANYPDTIWYQLAVAARHGTHSELYQLLTNNAVMWAGIGKLAAEVLVVLATAAAFTLSLRRA